ncbi:MBL fold metallo-hydrolase [Streptomyces sp. NBC_01483]|uniref:MBL fold metallo-hydrolase n=1 Tax=Streptomyces sp. NBC_01483 TaxID=2903883 RepID=UPI002E3495B1|nr:MBL fold metallo-hydrolase [Streptomyces sp. NBC_01483]
MSRPAPTQVAPGVHRLGDHGINFYLIEGPDGLILIDAGVPAHLEQLRGLLAGLGRSVGDVRAVLLTHGHLDHTGLAHTLQEAGAVIWIHERDAAILHDGPRSATRHAKPERSMLPYLLRRPSSLERVSSGALRLGWRREPVLCFERGDQPVTGDALSDLAMVGSAVRDRLVGRCRIGSASSST